MPGSGTLVETRVTRAVKTPPAATAVSPVSRCGIKSHNVNSFMDQKCAVVR